jgi:polyphenol oxidase
MTESNGGASRREFLSLLGAGAATGAAALILPYGSAAHAAGGPPTGQCAPPAGKVTSGPGSYANPIVFKPDTGPLRTRKSITKDAAAAKKLDDAYKLMRALPKTDPRSFDHQGDIHCWFCGMGTQIHGTYSFFPWHRAYLYFHEKILGSLIKDPTFALPYWDWANDRAIPAPYRAGNLANTTRDPGCNSGSKTLQDQLVGKAALSRPLDGTSTAGFIGDASHGGNFEFGPHGGVHVWAGGDMGQLDTAGHDTLFYGHHNNIDRYWAQWIGSSTAAKPRANPSDAAWGKLNWKFYGPDEKWYVITAKDVVDTKGSLKMTWNHDPGEDPGTRQSFFAREVESRQSSGGGAGGSSDELEFTKGAVHSTEPKSFKTALSATHKKQLSDLSTPYTLRVQDIEVPSNQGAIVKLHAVANADNKSDHNDKRYLGYIAVVPRSKAPLAHHQHKLSMALDVHSEVRSAVAGGSDANLTVVPSTIAHEKPHSIAFKHGRVFGHTNKRA